MNQVPPYAIRLRFLALVAVVLTLLVMALGAVTRLQDAGLGCPDWPGCYGKLVAPHTDATVADVQLKFPQVTVSIGKAWIEMVHRYAALALSLIALWLVFQTMRSPKRRASDWIPMMALGVIVFQALLGMWTVTLKLLPEIVAAHLVGGMVLLGLWSWYVFSRTPVEVPAQVNRKRWGYLTRAAQIGLLILAIQILLGGWTSTHYAAFGCPDFPTCGGSFWPETDFKGAFALSPSLGMNFTGGVLDNMARSTIHLTHRLGAVVTLVYWLIVGVWTLRILPIMAVRQMIAVILIILVLQIGLGIANVLLLLPWPIALLHNMGASLLLVMVIKLNYYLAAIWGKIRLSSFNK